MDEYMRNTKEDMINWWQMHEEEKFDEKVMRNCWWADSKCMTDTEGMRSWRDTDMKLVVDKGETHGKERLMWSGWETDERQTRNGWETDERQTRNGWETDERQTRNGWETGQKVDDKYMQ